MVLKDTRPAAAEEDKAEEKKDQPTLAVFWLPVYAVIFLGLYGLCNARAKSFTFWRGPEDSSAAVWT